MHAQFSRRAFLTGAAALALTPALALGGVPGVRVDVSPLRENGSGWITDVVAAAMPGALAQAFAAYGAVGGIVHARIRLVHLGAVQPGWAEPAFGWRGFGTRGFGRDHVQDDIEGEVWVTDGRGVSSPRVAFNTFTTVDEFAPGVDWVGQQRQRIADLCRTFAYWAPSRLGM